MWINVLSHFKIVCNNRNITHQSPQSCYTLFNKFRAVFWETLEDKTKIFWFSAHLVLQVVWTSLVRSGLYWPLRAGGGKMQLLKVEMGEPSCESVERKPKSWTILSIIPPSPPTQPPIAGFHSVRKTGLACVSLLDVALSWNLSSVFFKGTTCVGNCG